MTDPAPLRAGPMEVPGIRHGFFTRVGGVSKGIYAGLNCGLGSDDDDAAVRENRGRVARALGIEDGRLVTPHQIHGREVVVVERPWQAGEAPKCDALVTATPGIAVGVLAADCAPLLFADAHARVVGAAHAGWKGALARIGEAAVEAMESLGADRSRIHAAIGPAIGRDSYEVGPEFRARFTDADADNAAFFRASARPEHHLFDLAGFIRSTLDGLGLASVTDLAADTYPDAERFFSYRRSCHRDEPDYGRAISAIAIEPVE